MIGNTNSQNVCVCVCARVCVHHVCVCIMYSHGTFTVRSHDPAMEIGESEVTSTLVRVRARTISHALLCARGTIVLLAVAYVALGQIGGWIGMPGFTEWQAPHLEVRSHVRWDPERLTRSGLRLTGRGKLSEALKDRPYCHGVEWTGGQSALTWLDGYHNISECVALEARELAEISPDGRIFVTTYQNVFFERRTCSVRASDTLAPDAFDEFGPCSVPEWHVQGLRHFYVYAPERLELLIEPYVSAPGLNLAWDADELAPLRLPLEHVLRADPQAEHGLVLE